MYKSDRNLDVNSHLYRYLDIGLATLLAGGTNALSSAIGSWLGTNEAEKDREFNAQQAKLNRQFQRNERLASQEFELDMWNMNNEYNDIGSQIARARAAGVNPAAIIGGNYNSAVANPVTTQASQGSAASYNSGMGPAMMNGITNAGMGIADGVKSLVDSDAKIKETIMNRELIDSNIKVNETTIKEMLSRIGVNDATAANINASTYWMNQKGVPEIQKIIADYTKIYNENIAIFQQIRESMARTENIEAGTENINASTAGIKIENAYKPAMLSEQIEGQQLANDIAVQKLSQEELNTWVMQFKKDFAIALGMPVDSPEFMFNYILAINGEFGNYCNTVITPAARATWKPNDYNSKGGVKVGASIRGIPFYLEAQGESSLPAHIWYGAGSVWNTVAEALNGEARKDFKKDYDNFLKKYRK